ncbi:hypothetical protein ABIB40_003323 [Pedobacter sp. UYP30]|uniref:hypothetical protein n=1 Tax=Pedobacter sp. UYP30 TaxID=1756400 RepID=UPI0033911B5B
MVDGIGRLGSNAASAITPGAGSENLGGLIGRAVSPEDGEKWGVLVNDALATVATGGFAGFFTDAGIAAGAGNYATAAYYGLDGANTGVEIYHVSQNQH